jgi:hypothetical protein
MNDGPADDYHAAMVEALTKTVFEASLIDIDGKRTAYVRTTEACEALISVIAMLLEGAPNCQTPQGMRKMSEAVGRNTLVAMKAARQVREAKGEGILGKGVVIN